MRSGDRCGLQGEVTHERTLRPQLPSSTRRPARHRARRLRIGLMGPGSRRVRHRQHPRDVHAPGWKRARPGRLTLCALQAITPVVVFLAEPLQEREVLCRYEDRHRTASLSMATGSPVVSTLLRISGSFSPTSAAVLWVIVQNPLRGLRILGCPTLSGSIRRPRVTVKARQPCIDDSGPLALHADNSPGSSLSQAIGARVAVPTPPTAARRSASCERP